MSTPFLRLACARQTPDQPPGARLPGRRRAWRFQQQEGSGLEHPLVSGVTWALTVPPHRTVVSPTPTPSFIKENFKYIEKRNVSTVSSCFV